jgi:transposase
MKKRNRNYSPSFKVKAVELSYARGNVKQVCEELDIPYSVLHRWRKESTTYGKNSFPGRGKAKLTDEQKELAQLKKQLKDISEENEILKKVVSIFSVSDKRNLGL